jgi:hypothetical protein
VLPSFGAKSNHGKPIIRKRAKVDIIHAWMTAKLFNTPDKLRSMRLGKAMPLAAVWFVHAVI